jgi:hypothetical protein
VPELDRFVFLLAFFVQLLQALADGGRAEVVREPIGDHGATMDDGNAPGLQM